MKKNLVTMAMVAAIVMGGTVMEAAWVGINSLAPADGITTPFFCDTAVPPRAGDNPANVGVSGHLFFDLSGFGWVIDVAAMRLQFTVNTISGAPYAGLGNLMVSIHPEFDICTPAPITFIDTIAADGVYVINPFHPNYWDFYSVVEAALFGGSDVVVNFFFAGPTDGDAAADLVVIPSGLATLRMDVY